MRADELNTGDYVSWKPNDGKSKARFVKVRHNARNGEISVWYKKQFFSPSLDNLYPIDITPKLLEKNGLVCTKWVEDDTIHHETYSHIGDGTEVVTVDFADEGVVEVEVCKGTTSIISRDIRSLHLLQHILTLVGIWKEIVP